MPRRNDDRRRCQNSSPGTATLFAGATSLASIRHECVSFGVPVGLIKPLSAIIRMRAMLIDQNDRNFAEHQRLVSTKGTEQVGRENKHESSGELSREHATVLSWVGEFGTIISAVTRRLGRPSLSTNHNGAAPSSRLTEKSRTALRSGMA